MPASLPVSRVINVGVQLTPAAAQAQSLSNLLYLGTSPIIDTTERYRSYSSLAGVAAEFGTNADEYKAALKWFGQAPQPTSFIIGRFVNTASKGGLKCGTLSAAQQALATWQAITTGSFAITKDGAAAVQVTGLNFSGAANMPAIAAIIQAGTGMPAGVTVTWNAVYNRFEFESNTTGATSAIGFLAAPAAGSDVSDNLLGRVGDGGYLYTGQALETAAAALALFDDLIGQQFYGVAVGGLTPGANAGADTTALLAVAAYIEAANNKHILGITSQEAGALSAVVTTDIGYQLKALGYDRTLYQYSSSSPHAVLSLLARILTVDYEGEGTAITLKFKQEPGVVAETLTTSQTDAVEAKNYNVLVNYNNGTAIVEQGVMASGEFVDTITGIDWLAVTIQRDLFNALYSSNTKIPQTDQGVQVLTTVCAARCEQAVDNGLVAPGVWNAGGFGKLKQGDYLDKGYYIFASPVADQPQADRAARKAPPIQIAVKLAGAIHSVNATINVNQ